MCSYLLLSEKEVLGAAVVDALSLPGSAMNRLTLIVSMVANMFLNETVRLLFSSNIDSK